MKKNFEAWKNFEKGFEIFWSSEIFFFCKYLGARNKYFLKSSQGRKKLEKHSRKILELEKIQERVKKNSEVQKQNLEKNSKARKKIRKSEKDVKV